MRRSTRALTLIEVLASLALLGLLAAALSSWLQLTSTFAAKSAAMLPWESAAEELLRCVQEDLLIGDFAHERKESKEPRCIVFDDRLTIRTRDAQGGPVQREYEFEVAISATASSNGRLTQTTRSVTSAGHRQETRMLIGDLSAWTCELDAKTHRLTVSLTSTAGRTIRRSFACPH